jgi:hypothetical protein
MQPTYSRPCWSAKTRNTTRCMGGSLWPRGLPRVAIIGAKDHESLLEVVGGFCRALEGLLGDVKCVTNGASMVVYPADTGKGRWAMHVQRRARKGCCRLAGVVQSA